MAESKIPNSNIMPIISKENPGSGTANVTVLSCCQIKYGKMVFISARMQWNVSTTTGMDAPLLTLNRFIPTDSSEGFAPSIINVDGNVFSSLVNIKKFGNGNFYACQSAKSIFNKDAMIEMFFCYTTN